MNRDNTIQYRSPQQLPSSKKPNIENCPPQRNTNEFIKQMKKRIDQPPLSVVIQNSQVQDAQSIFIDVSRIEQQSNNSNNSFFDPLKQPILCHRSNQPSNCTTQRTNRYDFQTNSKPYLDQTDNMGMLFIQQQMLQLQNKNMILKQQLEKQESQRLFFQQQMLQQFQSTQQQQQQPIVINNNITSNEKQQSKSIPLQNNLEESYSPPKKIQCKKQQSQAIQTDKSAQDQSIIHINDSYQNESQLCNNNSIQIKQQQQIKSFQQQKTGIESLTFGTQQSQRSLIIQQSQQELKIQNYESQNQNQQSDQNHIEFQKEIEQNDVQIQNFKDIQIQRKHSQIDLINSSSLQEQTYNINKKELIRKQSQPSVKLEFNFEDEKNEQSKKSLADYFSQRKKTVNVERRVSVQMPIQEEDQSWIVNVKQRSKEEQIKLRKEMMEYGRNKRQQNKSQTPIIEDQSSAKKEQIKRMKSPLMERLALGQKAKVEEKEMFALTRKNYENLPEVKNKKNQEEINKQKQQFMKDRQNKLKELDDKIKEKMKKP
ncbi:unnamed protein product [Paramecium sonneborni]|uniref:Uncharacterized protein n=1 Tax=Paramecium sonneborni TaxID=65129 RepID=A0A8S1MMM8_9CILI|nr:unnamed protein product [Paramecium sonneborni]